MALPERGQTGNGVRLEARSQEPSQIHGNTSQPHTSLCEDLHAVVTTPLALETVYACGPFKGEACAAPKTLQKQGV